MLSVTAKYHFLGYVFVKLSITLIITLTLYICLDKINRTDEFFLSFAGTKTVLLLFAFHMTSLLYCSRRHCYVVVLFACFNVINLTLH